MLATIYKRKSTPWLSGKTNKIDKVIKQKRHIAVGTTPTTQKLAFVECRQLIS